MGARGDEERGAQPIAAELENVAKGKVSALAAGLRLGWERPRGVPRYPHGTRARRFLSGGFTRCPGGLTPHVLASSVEPTSPLVGGLLPGPLL
eukprot:2740951-Pyramimonas_sp.AAC.1